MAGRSARAETAAGKPYRVGGRGGAPGRAIDESGESVPECPLAVADPFAQDPA